eukprot:scaffold38604_cov33-Phaeocystis_antarctica.AAC.1
MEAGCPQDALAREASRDELQADGTGWVRAIWVAARQGSGGGCLILLLRGPPCNFRRCSTPSLQPAVKIYWCMHDRPGMQQRHKVFLCV